MHFVGFEMASRRIRGKRVALVGSAPSCLDNERDFVDSHDVVIRVNNYKTGPRQGSRTDVHYSFYGTSIRKCAEDLKADGVLLCMCKCPNGKPIRSEWHERMGRVAGIDFRYIYENRKAWWFCDTYIPSIWDFLQKFETLEKHIPTTGFSAILDVLGCAPQSLYLTGFDFFTSGLHNVDERWKPGDPQDMIGHSPERELAWLCANMGEYPIVLDARLETLVRDQAR